jgi:hypothetical protein
VNDSNHSPFEQPGMMTGYPLRDDEQRELEEALRRVEQPEDVSEGDDGVSASVGVPTRRSSSSALR